MKVFQDLTISGKEPDLRKLIAIMTDKSTHSGWKRDPKRERELESESLIKWPMYCFAFGGGAKRKGAKLYLSLRRKGGSSNLVVSNIVPSGFENLSYADYNLILNDYYDKLVVPFVKNSRLNVTLTKDVFQLSDTLSPVAAR